MEAVDLVSKQKQEEELRERRPPWLRQIITPILPQPRSTRLVQLDNMHYECRALVKGEPQSFWIITCSLIRTYYNFCSFTHLQRSGTSPNLITCSCYHPGPLRKISLQTVHNLLSNVFYRQTDKHNPLYQGGKKKDNCVCMFMIINQNSR